MAPETLERKKLHPMKKVNGRNIPKPGSVTVTFRISKKLPEFLAKWPIQQAAASKAKGDSGGHIILPSTERVSVTKLFSDLEEQGYLAICMTITEKFDDGRYFQVRLDFLPARNIEVTEEYMVFREKWSDLQIDFGKYFTENIWSLLVWSNPFYKDDEEIEGKYGLCLCFAHRDPLLGQDGKERVVHGNVYRPDFSAHFGSLKKVFLVNERAEIVAG